MSEPQRCPQCDAEIPANSPAGLCPRCLLKADPHSQSEKWEGEDHAEPAHTKASPPGSGFMPPTVEELSRLFPQLQILELIGKGGMGAVYKARQSGLDRLVALKILPPEISRDPAFAERFTREARALARLTHNHIVSVYDFGQSEGLFYIVMEFVDGANLRQTIRTGRLAAAEALVIVPQICEALQFAHDEGIVHRDIKPENILIDKRGRVKIADFGLAKLLGQDASDHSLTATHQVMGTLRYMAPEQMQGSREVDHRADIYSLGVVFYELLTGELPMGKFAPPSKKVQVDVRLDEVVLRALEQDPEQRYQHASDVKLGIETITGGAIRGDSNTRLPACESGSWESHPAGISTIVEREVRGAWRWVAGDSASPTQSPAFPGRLMILLSVAGCLMLMVPWLELHIEQNANVKQFWSNAELPGPFSRTLYGFERWPGIATGVAFGLLTLLLIMTPGRRSLTWKRAAVMSVIAAGAVLPTFLFKPELENGNFTIPIVQHEDARLAGRSGATTGDIHVVGEPRMERVMSRASVPLESIEHQVTYREGFYGSLALSVVLLVFSGIGVRRAAEQSDGKEMDADDELGAASKSLSRIRRQLKGPAIALMLYGLFLLFPAALCFTNGFDIADGNDATPAAVGFGMIAFSFLLLGLVGLIIRGGWHMLALESHRAAVLASFLGQPIGLWALFVLSRPDVKSAFPTVSRAKAGTGPAPMPQSPSDRQGDASQQLAAARFLVRGPAIGMAAVGIAAWVQSIVIALCLMFLPREYWTWGMLSVSPIVALAGIPFGAVLLAAGLQMGRLQAYTFAVLAGVLVYCVPLGVVSIFAYPVAIWAHIVLWKQEVADAFAQRLRERILAFRNGTDQRQTEGAPAGKVGAKESPRETYGKLLDWLFTGVGAVLGVLSVFWLLAILGLAAFLDRGDSTQTDSLPAPPPSLGTITSGIGAEFTVPAGYVATLEIVTRRDGETVSVPPHCGYVMAPPDSDVAGTFRWSRKADEADAPAGGRTWSLEILTGGGGRGYSEGTLLPEELDAAVGARGLGLGKLEPNEEVIHWGTDDANNLPPNGLIGLRVTVVAHKFKTGGSGSAHIDWRKAQSATSTTHRKLSNEQVDEMAKPDPNSVHRAAELGDAARVKQLLDGGASINAKDGDGQTPLMKAVAGGHRSLAITLVILGADLTEQDSHGLTALMIAAERRDSAFLSRLKQLYWLSYERDATERTKGLLAFPGVDRVLIEGRDIDRQGLGMYDAELLQDERGENVVMKAARAGDWGCLTLLSNQLATMQARDNLGRTVLMHAVLSGQAQNSEWLSSDGWLTKPPYFGVAGKDNVYVGTLVIFELETSLSVLDNEDKSVVQLAEAHGHTAVARILRRHLEMIITNQTAEIQTGGETAAKHFRLRALAWRALGEIEKSEAGFKKALPE